MQKFKKGEFEENLKLVINMLENNEHVKDSIKMEFYQKDVFKVKNTQHECQTAGCILGHSLRLLEKKDFQELLENRMKKLVPFFGTFSAEYFGVKNNAESWNFLFGPEWPDSSYKAVQRIKFYIMHNQSMHDVMIQETGEFSYHDGITSIDFEEEIISEK